MGYLTNYELTYQAPNAVVGSYELDEQILALLNTVTGYEWSLDCGSFAIDHAKWYEWEEHLLSISKKLPEIKFILDGEGEEAGDIWRAYIYQGKCEVARAKISFALPTIW